MRRARRQRRTGPALPGDQPPAEQAHHFERATVVAPDGRATAVYRRRCNLDRLRGSLGSERVEVLMLLRLVLEAADRGLTPRCALDRSPTSGFDGFLAVIQHRIEAARLADALCAVLPDNARGDVEAIVNRGLSVRQWQEEIGLRGGHQHARIIMRLARCADAVGVVLTERFGWQRIRRG